MILAVRSGGCTSLAIGVTHERMHRVRGNFARRLMTVIVNDRGHSISGGSMCQAIIGADSPIGTPTTPWFVASNCHGYSGNLYHEIAQVEVFQFSKLSPV